MPTFDTIGATIEKTSDAAINSGKSAFSKLKSVVSGGSMFAKKRDRMDREDDPETLESLVFQDNIGVLEYPQGLSAVASSATQSASLVSDSGPFISINIFNYSRGKLVNFGEPVSAPTTNVLYIIRLPLPRNLESVIGANIENNSSILNAVARADVGQLVGAAENMLGDVSGTIKNITDQFASSEGIASALTAVAALAVGGVEGAAKQIGMNYGLSLNPMTELMYVSPTLRSFAFEYTCIPKNEEESRELERLIEVMQDRMLPTTATSFTSLLLSYPNMFTITFHDMFGNEIPGILSIADSFLESFDVVYNPMGSGRLMTDGSPHSYRIAFSFKETRVMTQEDIRTLRPARNTTNSRLVLSPAGQGLSFPSAVESATTVPAPPAPIENPQV